MIRIDIKGTNNSPTMFIERVIDIFPHWLRSTTKRIPTNKWLTYETHDKHHKLDLPMHISTAS